MRHRIFLSSLHLLLFAVLFLQAVFFLFLFLSPSLRMVIFSLFDKPTSFAFLGSALFLISLIILCPFWIYHRGKCLIIAHKAAKMQVNKIVLEKYLKDFFYNHFGFSLKEVEILSSIRKMQITFFISQIPEKEKMDLVQDALSAFLEKHFSFQKDFTLIFVQRDPFKDPK